MRVLSATRAGTREGKVHISGDLLPRKVSGRVFYTVSRSVALLVSMMSSCFSLSCIPDHLLYVFSTTHEIAEVDIETESKNLAMHCRNGV